MVGTTVDVVHMNVFLMVSNGFGSLLSLSVTCLKSIFIFSKGAW